MANLSVAGFLQHHKNTVVSIGIVGMHDHEYTAAIAKASASDLCRGATEAEVYDMAMLILKNGPSPKYAECFALTRADIRNRVATLTQKSGRS